MGIRSFCFTKVCLEYGAARRVQPDCARFSRFALTDTADEPLWPRNLMEAAGTDRSRSIAAAILAAYEYRSRFIAYARAVTISLRAAQLARSCFWMAAAMRSGNKSGVQANEGIPRPASTCALC